MTVLELPRFARSWHRYLSASPVSRHLHGNRTEEILLSDLHTAMTQDRVGGGEVKIYVRQHEVVEVIVALHLPFVGQSKRKRDLTTRRRVDLLRVERLYEGDRLGEPCLELRDRGLLVLIAGRLRRRRGVPLRSWPGRLQLAPDGSGETCPAPIAY